MIIDTHKHIDLNSPVQFNNIELTDMNGQMQLSMDLINNSDKTVIAIQLLATFHDPFGKIVKLGEISEFKIQVIDLHIKSGETIRRTDIMIPTNLVRTIDICIRKVGFDNGEHFEILENHFIDVELTTYNTTTPEYEVIKEMFPNAVYEFQNEKEYWVCVCGNINNKQAKEYSLWKCSLCPNELKKLVDFSKPEVLSKLITKKKVEKQKEIQEADDKRLKQKQEMDKQIAAQKFRIRKICKIVLIALLSLMILAVASFTTFTIVTNNQVIKKSQDLKQEQTEEVTNG